ncbi:MAG: hypothetical protein DCC49_10005 [Acidobacteria bacterium]|nr:MAG: hypothetical protein DCC49_10005 [Acidobacteriota bacterium]
MTDSNLEDEDSTTAGASSDAADERAARREAARQKWMEKRAAEEAAKPPPRELSPAEKLVDMALTPSYVAVGAAVIVYRVLRGLPPVTDEDYEDE